MQFIHSTSGPFEFNKNCHLNYLLWPYVPMALARNINACKGLSHNNFWFLHDFHTANNKQIRKKNQKLTACKYSFSNSSTPPPSVSAHTYLMSLALFIVPNCPTWRASFRAVDRPQTLQLCAHFHLFAKSMNTHTIHIYIHHIYNICICYYMYILIHVYIWSCAIILLLYKIAKTSNKLPSSK